MRFQVLLLFVPTWRLTSLYLSHACVSWQNQIDTQEYSQVPEVDTAVRSLTVMWDGSLVCCCKQSWNMLCLAIVARNTGNHLISLVSSINFAFPNYSSPLTIVKISCVLLQTMTNFEPLHKLQAHDGYILKCLLSPELCEPHRLDFFFCHILFRSVSTQRIVRCRTYIPPNYVPRYLATASSDNTVKIWNVGGFTLEKTLVGTQLMF